jgi:hypothetical protein
MNRKVEAALAIAALLMTSAASAVTVTNRDAKDVTITVIEGDAKQDLVLQAGKVIEGVCQKGCIVRLGQADNDGYELEGSEAVSVEEGFLYYDSPVGEGAPQDGSTESTPDGKTK